MMRLICCLTVIVVSASLHAADAWLSLPGGTGPGKGKTIVLVSGDEEYRSEEALPQLAKILSKHHGFTCKVLFAIDPKDGTIEPNVINNIPGLDSLKTADLAIFFIRMRNLPDEQMQPIIDYVKSGKPIIALRTSTHPFALPKNSPFYADCHWQNPDGGFGRKVFGETWIAHHGTHGKEGTRALFAKDQETNPILKGVRSGEIFGPTDVYTTKLPLPSDCQPLLMGQVTKSLNPESSAVEGKKNNPMMPIAWTKSYSWAGGKTGKAFVSTMASSQDFLNEGLRRVVVNACYLGLGMESQIDPKSSVAIVGEYKPSPFKFKGHKTGVKPEDLK